MPVDTSIYGNLLRPPKSVAEYEAEYAQADANKLTNLMNQAKMSEYTRGVEQQNQLRGLLGGPETGDARVEKLRSAGFLKEAGDLSKQDMDSRKGASDVRKTDIDASTAAIKNYRGMLDYIDTPESASRWLQAQYQDPVLATHMKALGPMEQAITRIPTNPQAFQQWRQQAGMGMEAFQKKLQEDTKIAETGRNNREQNAISRGNLGVAQGNLSVSQQRLALDRADPKGVLDSERGLLVDPRTGVARPITMGGQAVGAKEKALTEGQAKANLFGTRMQEADRILGTMEQKGVTQPSLTKRAAEAVPLVGGALGMAANGLASNEQQQVEQAQRDFINAVLRRESGAAIATSEFDSASKQYFPQPNDGKDVRAQKARARQTAIQGLMAEVPDAKRSKPASTGGATGDFSPAGDDPLGLRGGGR